MAPRPTTKSFEKKNRLAQSKSPYLLQHRDNPVWWWEWCGDAFACARAEDKPIFLSIGYSTCHWCHVMEKDSFEKHDVAAALNKNFISIKLDREERPDVDSVYMGAVQAMTGHGGWPMSVIMTPDGKPFWTGTFIPHDRFLDLLTEIAALWKSQKSDLIKSGEKIEIFLNERAALPGSNYSPSEKTLILFYESFRNGFDELHGGTLGAPKFPSALAMSALLRIYRRTGEQKCLWMVEKTIQEMRRGGIYDQIGGGFHRYSVDDHWRIPHFEKMLYDNALMACVYAEAFQVTKKHEYARVVGEICDYVLRDMTDAQGGFYSAEDADSEGIEGKFYAWTENELKSILSPPDFEIFKQTFNIVPEGNFQVHRTGDEVSNKRLGPPALSANVLFLTSEAALPEKSAAIQKLFAVRSGRVRPHLDDKILAGWNGLMISALTMAYRVLNDIKYLRAATRAAHFVLSSLKTEAGSLLRSYRQGPGAHDAQCDDYALMIEACLNLYATDFNEEWVSTAISLQSEQDKHFWDLKTGGYFDNDGRDPLLIVRNKSFEDGVVPSPNSVSLCNLLTLTDLTGNMRYRKQAGEILNAAAVYLERYPQGVAKMIHSIDKFTDNSVELAVALPEVNRKLTVAEILNESTPKLSDFLKNNFNPNLTVAVSATAPESIVPLLSGRPATENKPTFYFCRNHACELPTHDETAIIDKISEKNTFALR